MKNLQAQIPVYPPGEKLEGEGPLGLEGKLSSEGILIFQKIISSAIGVITIIATIWFIVQFITGAVGIISSGGDKAKYEEARSKITNGLKLKVENLSFQFHKRGYINETIFIRF